MLPTTTSQLLEEAVFHPTDETACDAYAILDGAAVRRLPDYFDEQRMEYAPLIRGETNPVLVTRIPYLVRLVRREPSVGPLLAEGWGRHWGIFATFPLGTPFVEALAHFRQVSQVRLPDGRIVYFRFYDPRVLRPFLPSCDEIQLGELFGGLLSIRCENEDASALLEFSVRATVLRTGAWPLVSFGAAASLQPVVRRFQPA